jgi:hypothetical protein
MGCSAIYEEEDEHLGFPSLKYILKFIKIRVYILNRIIYRLNIFLFLSLFFRRKIYRYASYTEPDKASQNSLPYFF